MKGWLLAFFSTLGLRIIDLFFPLIFTWRIKLDVQPTFCALDIEAKLHLDIPSR